MCVCVCVCGGGPVFLVGGSTFRGCRSSCGSGWIRRVGLVFESVCSIRGIKGGKHTAHRVVQNTKPMTVFFISNIFFQYVHIK